MPVDAHSVSLGTRRQILEVLWMHRLDSKIVDEYGLIDRMIRGQLLCEDGKVKFDWNPTPLLSDDQWPVSVEVDSASRDEKTYLVGVLLTKVSDIEIRQLHRALMGKVVYEIKDVGGEIQYKKPHRTINISAHACKDGFFQQGFKGLPGICMHRVAAAMYVYDQAGRDLEQQGLAIIPRYLDMGEDLINFYKEIEQHSLKAADRLDLLYKFAKGDLRMYRTGRQFLKSVGLA